tara:strand:- start:37 stop:243 length:207 start_codon:yes stop_codon:yes gene_type:complete
MIIILLLLNHKKKRKNKTMNNNYIEQKDILIGYFLEINDDNRIKKDIKENILNCLENNIDKLELLIDK